MIKVCIVGCGAISAVHARAVENSENSTLFAVCDIDKKRADKLSEKYSVKAYYDYNDVLEDRDIDAVHICTPHYLHVDMAISALSAGKYVVLEKPAAMNLSEFNRLKAADGEHPGKLCMILQNRTNGCSVKLKELVENEDNGKFLGAKGFLCWNRSEAYYAQDAWRGKWATEGGGVLINQAVHTLDLLCWIGGGAKNVKASISTKLRDFIEVEDTADALIELNSGARACFYATNCYGTDSRIILEFNFENVTYRYSDDYLYKIEKGKTPEVIAGENINVGWKSYWGDGHKSVIRAFYSAKCGGDDSYITLKDAENSSKALFAIYESAKNNGLKIEID